MDPITIGFTVFAGLLSAASKAPAGSLTQEERDAIDVAVTENSKRNAAIADAALKGGGGADSVSGG